MEHKPTEEKSGYFRMKDEELEFVVQRSLSNDDVLKTFSIFLMMLFGMIVSGIIWLMSYVFEFPVFIEFLQN